MELQEALYISAVQSCSAPGSSRVPSMQPKATLPWETPAASAARPQLQTSVELLAAPVQLQPHLPSSPCNIPSALHLPQLPFAVFLLLVLMKCTCPGPLQGEPGHMRPSSPGFARKYLCLTLRRKLPGASKFLEKDQGRQVSAVGTRRQRRSARQQWPWSAGGQKYRDGGS